MFLEENTRLKEGLECGKSPDIKLIENTNEIGPALITPFTLNCVSIDNSKKEEQIISGMSRESSNIHSLLPAWSVHSELFCSAHASMSEARRVWKPEASIIWVQQVSMCKLPYVGMFRQPPSNSCFWKVLLAGYPPSSWYKGTVNLKKEYERKEAAGNSTRKSAINFTIKRLLPGSCFLSLAAPVVVLTAQHGWDTGHTIQFGKTTLLCKLSSWPERVIWESLESQLCKEVMNKRVACA